MRRCGWGLSSRSRAAMYIRIAHILLSCHSEESKCRRRRWRQVESAHDLLSLSPSHHHQPPPQTPHHVSTPSHRDPCSRTLVPARSQPSHHSPPLSRLTLSRLQAHVLRHHRRRTSNRIPLIHAPELARLQSTGEGRLDVDVTRILTLFSHTAVHCLRPRSFRRPHRFPKGQLNNRRSGGESKN